MNKKILGIIPARGGSKSIPRKNIKMFAGKPLIVWSIQTAIDSGVIDRLIVSTDDEEIADISKKAGAGVPFIRPGELAMDDTPTLPVLQHAVKFLQDNDSYKPDYILLMEATSPCRQPFHLQEAVEILESTGADSVVAVGEVPKHFSPYWQLTINKEKKINLFNGDIFFNIIERRQDLPVSYFRNGAFYLFKTRLLFSDNPSIYGEDVRGYIMESKYSTDIDTLDDWNLAEKNFNSIINKI